ncbi:hypothetical protein ACF0H5_008743 [Mactra antiquata]
MAQAQIKLATSDDDVDHVQIISSDEKDNRKVNMCLGKQRYISVFKNDQNETQRHLLQTWQIFLELHPLGEIDVPKENGVQPPKGDKVDKPIEENPQFEMDI